MTSASAILPIDSRPLPPSTVNVIGTRSTDTTSPINPARSAIAPPSCPVNTLSSWPCCSSLEPSSTNTAAFQEAGVSTLPGMWTDRATVRPVTSTPSIAPLSMCQASAESQVPPSGSSPIQQGQSTLQEQTSSSLPSMS